MAQIKDSHSSDLFCFSDLFIIVRHKHRTASIGGAPDFRISSPSASIKETMELSSSMKSCPWILMAHPPLQASWWSQSISPHSLQTALPGLANKNTQCSVKYQFQIKPKYLFCLSVSHAIFGTHLCNGSVCCLSEKILFGSSTAGELDFTGVSKVRSVRRSQVPRVPGQELQHHTVSFRNCLSFPCSSFSLD